MTEKLIRYTIRIKKRDNIDVIIKHKKKQSNLKKKEEEQKTKNQFLRDEKRLIRSIRLEVDRLKTLATRFKIVLF